MKLKPISSPSPPFTSTIRNSLKRSFSIRLLANQKGMTYLLVMFIIIIGISLMALGQHCSVIIKRDREAELFFRGTRIQKAIERFTADHGVQTVIRENKYPLKLEDLTKKPKRYLPVAYDDPITGKLFDFIKVRGQIRGVRSSSKEVPLDQEHFKGAATYAAITFQARESTNSQPQDPIHEDSSDSESKMEPESES